jgi:hypothetical protein
MKRFIEYFILKADQPDQVNSVISLNWFYSKQAFEGKLKGMTV